MWAQVRAGVQRHRPVEDWGFLKVSTQGKRLLSSMQASRIIILMIS